MRELERGLVPSPDATIAIVGRGRVGSSLARAAERAGLDATLAAGADARDACRDADAALLCVPDEAIAETCEGLAEATPPLVGHVSGASALGTLEAAARLGSATFSLHPLQTFPDGATDVAGMPCAISASEPLGTDFATGLALQLGMRPFELDDEARAAYHAAASIASNLLVALEESAVELLARAGVDDARGLLAPLVRQSAANWSERGPDALTGPIARGDAATVERHREAIAELAPELLDSYDSLAGRARAIAARRAVTDPAVGA